MLDDGCEELRFTRLMDSHVCYDLIPHTSKLVVFDTQLTVSKHTRSHNTDTTSDMLRSRSLSEMLVTFTVARHQGRVFRSVSVRIKFIQFTGFAECTT